MNCCGIALQGARVQILALYWPPQGVALDVGETLDVALVENDRIIGTLSLSLKGLGAAAQRTVRTGVSASNLSSEPGTTPTGRKPRRKLSPEARARMAEAQRLRWAKRNSGGQGSSES
jgi:hypothetical protein